MRRMNALIWCIAIFALGTGESAAQGTETVLYSFGANSSDAIDPSGRLIFDNVGNLYGTTQGGGSSGFGTAYELSPSDAGWRESVIYNFCSAGFPNCSDGNTPGYGMVLDGQGNLYGSTSAGGTGSHCPGQDACGVVFELSASPGGLWNETVLWSFGNSAGDGCGPGELTWDISGNLYGVAGGCGRHGGGAVFELSPPSAGNGDWTETILYSFCPGGTPCSDGSEPVEGVVFDAAGNLYGATLKGGAYGGGVVYELSPPVLGDAWTEAVLLTLREKTGIHPEAGVSIDQTGNVYGTAATGGLYDSGTAFRLTPGSGGVWQAQEFAFDGTKGRPNSAPLIEDRSIYGTTGGSVFRFVGKNEAVVYRFCSQPNCADGGPTSGPVIESAGSLYGVASSGGAHENGVVYQISP